MADTVPSPTEDTASLGVLAELIGYHLRRASAVMASDFARALEGTGVRQVLFGILSIVDANPGINQGTVGRMLGIQRANMVAPVNELAERGWIDRQTDPGDRRAFILSLTADGHAMFVQALAQIRLHEANVLRDLDAGDHQQLIDLLARIEAREG
ncbi:MarR family transcriptional regulator [Sphingomonas sp. RB3P16]|uniref:MarR family winged helix-turn-helix transcriptional regulator n=1 Tax=Parasphingomonas frigoris TaxID=3096163 RepID=UPI002FC8A4E4